jgi:hypothetical protein
LIHQEDILHQRGPIVGPIQVATLIDKGDSSHEAISIARNIAPSTFGGRGFVRRIGRSRRELGVRGSSAAYFNRRA